MEMWLSAKIRFCRNYRPSLLKLKTVGIAEVFVLEITSRIDLLLRIKRERNMEMSPYFFCKSTWDCIKVTISSL